MPTRHAHATPEAEWGEKWTSALGAAFWAECHRARTDGRVATVHQWPGQKADAFAFSIPVSTPPPNGWAVAPHQISIAH